MNEPATEVLDRSVSGDRSQSVIKVDTAAGPVVVKRYGRRRNRFRDALVQFGHWTFAGKSALDRRARCRTEAVCLALWRRHGFDVFREVDHHEPSTDAPHLVLEYAEGRTLYRILRDKSVSEVAKTSFLERFAAEWGRRHRLAMDLSEPHLLHERGTFRHVFVSGERLVHFDFEIAWVRTGRVLHLIGREVASFIRSLGKASSPQLFDGRLRVLIGSYPHPDLLRAAILRAGGVGRPVSRLVFVIERYLRRDDPLSPPRILERVSCDGLLARGSDSTAASPLSCWRAPDASATVGRGEPIQPVRGGPSADETEASRRTRDPNREGKR